MPATGRLQTLKVSCCTVPAHTLPKLPMPVTETSGACDWPETATSAFGVPGSLLATSSVATLLPVGRLGWNRSLSCSEAPGATVKGKKRVLGVRNSGSDGRIPVTLSGQLPELLIVSGRSANE